MKRNSEFRSEALQALEGNWGSAALVAFVAMAITSICGSILQIGGTRFVSSDLGSISSILGTIVCLPISYALTVAFLRLLRGVQIGVNDLFAYYNKRVFMTMLLKFVYVVLWSLLLIVPGIIKSYSYAMTEFLMLDDPELEKNKAIEKSMEMMSGNKMRLFLLDLSFIGWILLCILTLGIGVILLEPYIETAHAAFYEDLKTEKEAQSEYVKNI